MQVVKIPSERVSALIGKQGATASMLQKKCKVTITATPDGAVEIEGEPVDEFFSKDVVKAIGRGFEPSVALKLLQDNYVFKIIDIKDFASSREAISRIKSRVIGTEGKTKRIIETDADCDLCIYGYTVSVIATLETIDLAVNAVLKIVEGSNHSTVYAYLERSRARMKEERVKQALGFQ